MEQLFLLLGLAFAANKIVTVIKGISAKSYNLAFTQVLVWVVGFFILLIATKAQVTQDLVVPGLSDPLGDLDFFSVIVLALVTGSTGSVVYDFKKAIDTSDSASEPRLL